MYTKTKHHASELAKFIRATLPIAGMATLTIPVRHRCVTALDSLFTEWIRSISRDNRRRIAWIRADETYEWLHTHVLIVAHGPISHRLAESSWLTLCGTGRKDHALVTPYEGDLGGARYVLKSMEEGRDHIQLSHNIESFKTGQALSHLTGTARSRRSAQRIRNEIKFCA